MRRKSTASSSCAAAMCALACAAILFSIGCGKSPVPANDAGKTPAKKAATTPSQQTPAAFSAPRSTAFLSIFSTENPRDPFNPQIKPKVATAAVLTGPQGDAEAPQVIAAIQNGFQGIFASGDERELMVHGVLMRENRESTVTVPINGQLRKLKVKALKIYRNAAELQVEGLSQKVTVPKAR